MFFLDLFYIATKTTVLPASNPTEAKQQESPIADGLYDWHLVYHTQTIDRRRLPWLELY